MNQSIKLFHRLAMLTITATLALVGCDDSSTEPNEHELVGRWKWQGGTLYSGSIESPDSTLEDTPSFSEVPGEEEWYEIDLKNDYSTKWYVFIDGNYPVLTGAWSVENNMLTLTLDSDDWFTLPDNYLQIYSITGDILTLTWEITTSDTWDWEVNKYSRMNN